MTPGRSGREARDARRFARFRWALASGTIALVGLSAPLWLDGGGLPQVPLVAAWPVPSRTQALTGLIATLAATGAIALGRGGRWAWLLAALGFAGLIVGDQNRLQPWAMQFLVIALGTAVLGQRRGLGLARWYAVILYAASGLSKLDAAFADELGPAFLRALGGRLGFDPIAWSPESRVAAALAMPGMELTIALLLAIPGTRWVGLAGSVGQHLATILILGPGGLDHSAIVLAWNGLMIVENLALFLGPGRDWRPSGWANLAGLSVIAALAVGERSGVIDSWPGHALYASHAEQARLDWPDALADRLPSSIPLGPADAEGFRRVDLTAWSRRVRGVPIYPQNRVVCGIAESLARRFGDPTGPPPRLTLRSRAGILRTPPRSVVEVRGLRAIARQGDRSLLNAHPATGPGVGP